MDVETVNDIFAVPLFLKVWPDTQATNAELQRVILERMPAASKRLHSNVGGWHSEGADLLSWGGSAVEQLGRWILQATKDMTLSTTGLTTVKGRFTVWAWANVLETGGYNLVHDHPRHGWSGVYYVVPGNNLSANELAGQIEFIDPRNLVDAHPLPGNPFAGEVRIKPEAGMMLMFPGWLKHYVHPYQGAEPRISISFNVRYEEPQEELTGEQRPL